jgi:DNA-binding GntR family transcriptional regulator
MFTTASGRSPVRQFFDTLSDAELEQVAASMKTVANLGAAEARHLRGDIYEVRATCDNRAFRVLCANEGR